MAFFNFHFDPYDFRHMFPDMERSVNHCSGKRLLSGLACLIVASCASVSVDDEARVGASLDQQVRAQVGVTDDPELRRFTKALGARLVAVAEPNPYQFRFEILDQPEPNAFAAPGGYVYISRGLMVLVDSEDELAGVVGHEISHVTRRHHVQQAKQSVIPGLLSAPGRIVGVVNEDVGRVMTSPFDAYIAGYSRSQETEADSVGMAVAARAGYDPAALGEILQRIDGTVSFLTGETRQASWTDSHPTTPDRVENIENQAAQLSVVDSPSLAGGETGFLELLDGLWIGPNPEAGVFDGQRFIQPVLGMEITFPEAWDTFNSASMVGAMTESQDAVIVVGASPRLATPETMAQALASEVRQATGLEPIENRRVEIGDWEGHLLQFVEGGGDSTVGVYYLFVDSGEVIYELVAGAEDKYRGALRETALSLGPADSADIAKVTGLRLRIVTAREGESLLDFAARSDNLLEPAALALINDLPPDHSLGAGQKVKIAREEACCR